MNVSAGRLFDLRGEMNVTQEVDYSSMIVTSGTHPIMGLLCLISSPESNGNIVIAQDLGALSHG
jgi:hypothetical protein